MSLTPPIREIAEQFRKRELSPVDLTAACLTRIKKLNPVLNAFITVTSDDAMNQAHAAEAEIQRGISRGPLHGIPIALKDLVDTAGVRTTAASAQFEQRIPTEDAEVVRRLKSAGAVLLGKQNLHEFAYGGSSIISFYGEVRNPWNVECIAGGSSGGSAAGVAAGLGLGAIGTDTAGSVREPAAQCGVVGLKPTFGRVSVRGVIPLSASLDHVGPLARTVEDAAILFQAIAGHDSRDPWSVDRPVDDYLAKTILKPKRFRLGIPRKFFFDDLDAEVGLAIEQAITVLAGLGMTLQEVDLEVPTDRTLSAGEAYAYHKERVASSPELFLPATLERIRAGEGVSEKRLSQLRTELARMRNDIGTVFEQVDLLITPAVPLPAPEIAELQRDPSLLRPKELVLLRNTRPFNVWGLPAISVPCGFTRGGLPIGLQIAGPHWGESSVLQIAHAYEQATDWHQRVPSL